MPFTFGEEDLNLDDSVSTMCSVTKGDLPLKLFWSFQSKDSEFAVNLTTGDGIVITRTGQRSISLNIDAIKRHMVGIYQCVASNKAGTVVHSAMLAINGSIEFFKKLISAEIFDQNFAIYYKLTNFNFFSLSSSRYHTIFFW